MKFLCDKCKTRYTIADEKVRGKVLKIRCKNCGNVIEVREPSEAPERPAASPMPASTQGALKAQRRHGSQVDRLKAPLSGAGSGPSAARQAGGAPSARPATPARPGTGGSAAPASRPTPSARPDTGSRPAPKPSLRSEVSAALHEPEFDDPKTMIAAMPAELLAEAQQAKKAPGPGRAAGAGRAPGGLLDDGVAVWYLGDDRGEYGPMTFSELAARVKRGEPGPSAEVWKEGMDDWLALEEVPELKPFLKRAPPPRPTATTRAAPPSPYQKRPELDAAPGEPAPTVDSRPSSPKSLSVTAEYDEPLGKPPGTLPATRPAPASYAAPAPASAGYAAPAPASAGYAAPAPASAAPAPAAPAPAAADAQWPAPPAAPGSRPDLDVFSLPTELPPAASASPGAGPKLLPASHVSLRAASDLGSLLVAEQKRARRPILVISLAAVLIAGAAVALVIWLISSGKKPSEGEGKPKVAEKTEPPRAMEPPMAATQPLGMEAARPADDGGEARELPELDIDVTPGRERPRAPRLRSGIGPGPRPRDAVREPPRRVGSGSADPLSIPPHRPRFAGIDGFGSPRPSDGGSAGGAGGGAPANLGTVVKRNYNKLKRCYEQAARMDSRLRNPKLSISIKVSSSGRVSSVYVSPARYAADTLGICVRRSISSWKFPGFASGYKYAFTARFHGG